MKIFLTILLFSIPSFLLKAQSLENIILPPIVIAGDTLEDEVILEPIIVSATKLKPVTISYRNQVYLNKVYPYALRIARLSQVINEQMKKMSKKEKHKFLDNAEKLLRDAYEKELKNMTRTQGNFLIKLVYRETGVTVFDLLKEYRGGFKTFWWNFGSKFFDLHLKATYDPDGADAEIENYVVRLDEIYQRNGTKYIIQNEKFNLNIQSKKGKSKGNSSE